ncbi:phosphopantetheine-binding protein [Streptomyces griseus]|uniref:phosphopantetheine-binding protein n=1 Tax=Streptomyces griseus TaxID=1911 RepID=UPI00083FE511|nr:phosphopantetheine-binding protein [Streptomyces griseus]
MTGDDLRSAVRTVWEEVLGTVVDDDTEFFDAGGTSFAALRIIATINGRRGTSVSVKVLFDHSRFGDFTAALDRETGLVRQV